MNGKLAHPFDLSSVPALNLTRLDSVLQKLPKQIELEKGKCDALIQQEADARKQLGVAFPQEEELKERVARLEELTQELDIDSGGKETFKDKEKKEDVIQKIRTTHRTFSCLRLDSEQMEETEELEI